MSFITLAEAKLHLRVTNNYEDVLIESLVAAACEYCGEYCGRVFRSTVPATVKAAGLLVLGDLFSNREASVVGVTIAENPAVKNLLFSSIDFDGRAAGDAGFDDDGIIAGDTWSQNWQWFDEVGAPINVTGYTATLEIAKVLYPVSVSDAVLGKFEIRLTPAQTSALAKGRSTYIMRVTSPLGAVTTLDRKFFNVIV